MSFNRRWVQSGASAPYSKQAGDVSRLRLGSLTSNGWLSSPMVLNLEVEGTSFSNAKAWLDSKWLTMIGGLNANGVDALASGFKFKGITLTEDDVVFSSAPVDGSPSVWTVNPSTGPQQLTTSDISAYSPSYSPDGTKAAIVIESLGRKQIAVLTLGTGHYTVITPAIYDTCDPCWEPIASSNRVAVSTNEGGLWHIRIIDATSGATVGSDVTSGGSCDDHRPTFATGSTTALVGGPPDSYINAIFFVRNSATNSGIYRASLSGGSPTHYSAVGANDDAPAGFGSSLLFVSDRVSGFRELYLGTQTVGGESVQRVTDEGWVCSGAAWIDSGTIVASLKRPPDDNYSLFTISLNSLRNFTKLTNGAGDDLLGSVHGSTVIFSTKNAQANSFVCTTSTTTAAVTPITAAGADVFDTSFSSVGSPRYVAFVSDQPDVSSGGADVYAAQRIWRSHSDFSAPSLASDGIYCDQQPNLSKGGSVAVYSGLGNGAPVYGTIGVASHASATHNFGPSGGTFSTTITAPASGSVLLLALLMPSAGVFTAPTTTNVTWTLVTSEPDASSTYIANLYVGVVSGTGGTSVDVAISSWPTGYAALAHVATMTGVDLTTPIAGFVANPQAGVAGTTGTTTSLSQTTTDPSQAVFAFLTNILSGASDTPSGSPTGGFSSVAVASTTGPYAIGADLCAIFPGVIGTYSTSETFTSSGTPTFLGTSIAFTLNAALGPAGPTPNFRVYRSLLTGSLSPQLLPTALGDCADPAIGVDSDTSEIVAYSRRATPASAWEIRLYNQTAATDIQLASSGNNRSASWVTTNLIVFSTDRDGHEQIYSMTDTGGSQTRLLNTTTRLFTPSVGDDGNTVVFVEEIARGSRQLCYLKLDSLGLPQKYHVVPCPHTMPSEPALLPGCTSVAYTYFENGVAQIFQVPLTPGATPEIEPGPVSGLKPAGRPSWSANQSAVEFVSTITGFGSRLFPFKSANYSGSTVVGMSNLRDANVRERDVAANATDYFYIHQNGTQYQLYKGTTNLLTFASSVASVKLLGASNHLLLWSVGGTLQTSSTSGTSFVSLTSSTGDPVDGSYGAGIADDGSCVIFADMPAGGVYATYSQLHRYDMNTGAVTQLTDTPDDKYDPSYTTASGGSIVFATYNAFSGLYTIHKCSADGSNTVPLLPGLSATNHRKPRWSPDGSQVSFYMAPPDGSPAAIAVCNPLTGEFVVVSAGVDVDMESSIGASGSHPYYCGDTNAASRGVYVFNGGPTRLTNLPYSDYAITASIVGGQATTVYSSTLGDQNALTLYYCLEGPGTPRTALLSDVSVAPQSDPHMISTGQIVFTRPDGIYTTTLPTSGNVASTLLTSNGSQPRLSADGTLVVFIRNKYVYYYDIGASTSYQVTPHTASIGSESSPSFTSVGRIVFERAGRIFICEQDGSNETYLWDGSNPCVSTQYDQVTYTKLVGGTNIIFTQGLDGSPAVPLWHPSPIESHSPVQLSTNLTAFVGVTEQGGVVGSGLYVYDALTGTSQSFTMTGLSNIYELAAGPSEAGVGYTTSYIYGTASASSSSTVPSRLVKIDPVNVSLIDIALPYQGRISQPCWVAQGSQNLVYFVADFHGSPQVYQAISTPTLSAQRLMLVSTVDVAPDLTTYSSTSIFTAYTAISFVASGSVLAGIDLSFYINPAASNTTDALTLTLHEDAGGAPGSALGTIDTIVYGSVPSTSGQHYNMHCAFALVQGARYWVVAQVSSAPAGGTLYFASTTGTSNGAVSATGASGSWTNPSNTQFYINPLFPASGHHSSPRAVSIPSPTNAIQVTFASDFSGSWRVYTTDSYVGVPNATTPSLISGIPSSASPIDMDALITSDGNTIVYSSGSTLHRNLYYYNDTNGSPIQLTDAQADHRQPRFADSSATVVLFTSDRTGVDNVYAIISSVSEVGHKVTVAASDDWPAWAPDGSFLFFTSGAPGTQKIYRRNPTGAVYAVTSAGSSNHMRPRISPDSSTVAYALSNGTICIANATSGSPDTSIVVKANATAKDPSWSPNGLNLIYAKQTSGQFRLCTCLVTGSADNGLAYLTSGGGAYDDVEPCYSAEGRFVAFVSDRIGVGQVYLLDLISGGLTRLTSHNDVCSGPAFSYDGKNVYYCRQVSGFGEIWKVSLVDGSDTAVYAVPGYSAEYPSVGCGAVSAWLLSQDPSLWPDFPINNEDALPLGGAPMDVTMRANSQKFALQVFTPPTSTVPTNTIVSGLRLKASFQAI